MSSIVAQAGPERAHPQGLGAAPSPWVRRHAAMVSATGWVLDLACGGGRHIGLLRSLGCRVIGVDRDAAAAAMQWRDDPAVRIVAADLETGGDPFREGPLAAVLAACGGVPASGAEGALGLAGIVCTNYLHRPLLPLLPGLLAPCGVLIYETFAVGQARFGRPSRPEFLLRPGELLEATAGLVCLAYQHGLHMAETHDGTGGAIGVAAPTHTSAAMIQRIVAWKSPEGWDGTQMPPLS